MPALHTFFKSSGLASLKVSAPREGSLHGRRTHPLPCAGCHPAQVDGSAHVVHSEEEALGTRLTIDSKTCLLSNEHDPSQVGTRGCGCW